MIYLVFFPFNSPKKLSRMQRSYLKTVQKLPDEKYVICLLYILYKIKILYYKQVFFLRWGTLTCLLVRDLTQSLGCSWGIQSRCRWRIHFWRCYRFGTLSHWTHFSLWSAGMQWLAHVGYYSWSRGKGGGGSNTNGNEISLTFKKPASESTRLLNE